MLDVYNAYPCEPSTNPYRHPPIPPTSLIYFINEVNQVIKDADGSGSERNHCVFGFGSDSTSMVPDMDLVSTQNRLNGFDSKN